MPASGAHYNNIFIGLLHRTAKETDPTLMLTGNPSDGTTAEQREALDTVAHVDAAYRSV